MADRMTTNLTRRDTFVGMAAAVAAAPAPAGAARARAATTYDLSDPATRVRAYVAMRARLDGKRTFMPYAATIFGKVEGKMATPLFDVQGFSWATATRTGPDRYRLTNTEVGHFCDLVTGEPLKVWRNPLNNIDVQVKNYRSSQFLDVGPEGIAPVVGAGMGGAQLTHSWGKPTIIDGMVWMHEDLIGIFPNKPKEAFDHPLEYVGPQLTATSLATWSARIEDLARLGDGFVPAMLSYQTMGNWRPFMRMGSTPGIISWRMFGKKVASVDGVPAVTRERVLREHPDFLTRDPVTTSGL